MSTIKQTVSRKTIALFWQHAARYKRFFIPLLILIPINILVGDFIAPYITSTVLQKISTGAFDPHDIWSSFGLQLVGYTACVFLSGVLGWRLIVWLTWHLENYATRDISQKVFNHLMRMSASFHNNRFGGSIVSQANKLTGSFERFMDSMLFNLYTLLVAMMA